MNLLLISFPLLIFSLCSIDMLGCISCELTIFKFSANGCLLGLKQIKKITYFTFYYIYSYYKQIY